jgi:hypothetical protein
MKDNTKNNPMVRVFVPPSFEGVTSVAILEEIISDKLELDTVYINNLDFREYEQFKGADIIIVAGLPYRGYALPQDFFTTVDAPFTDFIHSSTYGEVIEGERIVSTVVSDMDPIKDIVSFLTYSPEASILSKHVTLSDRTNYLVEAVNDYRTWSWEGNDTTRVLLALYHASYKRLPNMIRNLKLQDIVKEHAPLIKGQLEKMNDYITRKAQMTKIYNISIEEQPCLMKVVFADDYINELANHLLNENTSMPIIVCVGRATKSSDIFSIRTRKVDASKVAYLINEGKGKESVATFFSGVSYAELMGNAFVQKLEQNQNPQ